MEYEFANLIESAIKSLKCGVSNDAGPGGIAARETATGFGLLAIAVAIQ